MYEIKATDGKIWKYSGESGYSTDFQIVNRDTVFRTKRPNITIHEWWYPDSIIDTTWYPYHTMQVTLFNRNNKHQLIFNITGDGISTITEQRVGKWGEEKEQYSLRDLEPACVYYGYYESDTSYWMYKYLGKNHFVEHVLYTPTGKRKRTSIWSNGKLETFAHDTLVKYRERMCGTQYRNRTFELPKGFDVVLDSALTKSGPIKSLDKSELMVLGPRGWQNWPTAVQAMKKELHPNFKKDQSSIPVEWVSHGKYIVPFSEEEYGWLFMSGNFQVGALRYGAVEWNKKVTAAAENISVYFHLQNLD